LPVKYHINGMLVGTVVDSRRLAHTRTTRVPTATPPRAIEKKEIEAPQIKNPKVLLVADVKDWAFANIARSLCVNSTAFEYELIFKDGLKKTKYGSYGVIHFFHWSLYFHWKKCGNVKLPHQVITMGIHAYEDSPYEYEYFKEVSALSVTCRGLETRFNARKEATPVYYCPDGIELSLFKKTSPILTGNKIRLGWTGNSAWGWDKKDKKGLHTILEKAVVGLDYELLIADKEDRQRTQEEMVEWYNSIDVLVCASVCEGTPLPLLEAAACERAVLTTDVGIVPEFNSGQNCIVYERRAEVLHQVLKELTREKISKLAKMAYKTVQAWDRKSLAKNYEKMWADLTRRYINVIAFPLENNYGGVEISAHNLTLGLTKLGYKSELRVKTNLLDICTTDVVIVHFWDDAKLLARVSEKTQNIYLCVHQLCINQLNWIPPSHESHHWLQKGIQLQEEMINKYKNVFVFNPYQRDLAKFRFSARVECLVNGIEIPQLEKIDKIPNSVLFSGRIEDHKGVPVFLEAMDALLKNGTLSQCKMVGTICQSYAVPEGVVLLGKKPRNEVLSLYAEAKVLVMTSRYESFPYVILEAGIHRCCVVTTDIAGFRAIFGDAVVYVPQNDPEALASTLTQLFANPKLLEQKSELLFNLIKDKYSELDMAKTFIRKLNL